MGEKNQNKMTIIIKYLKFLKAKHFISFYIYILIKFN